MRRAQDKLQSSIDGPDTKDAKPSDSSGYAVWAELKFEKLLELENPMGISVRFGSLDDNKKRKE